MLSIFKDFVQLYINSEEFLKQFTMNLRSKYKRYILYEYYIRYRYIKHNAIVKQISASTTVFVYHRIIKLKIKSQNNIIYWSLFIDYF